MELTGHGTDGRFGWDLFDGMVVELDYDLGNMIVHSQLPEKVKKDKAYEKLNITFYDKLFFVETTIQQGAVKNKDWFLFDTGYQRTVMLDGPLLKEQKFPTDQMKII
ncbi:MAG TPA: clan AA aspartic protease, partial [Chryseobacterium indologenes]|nr:clan AA aspartic protease [Chryseobacterium indologenes]